MPLAFSPEGPGSPTAAGALVASAPWGGQSEGARGVGPDEGQAQEQGHLCLLEFWNYLRLLCLLANYFSPYSLLSWTLCPSI